MDNFATGSSAQVMQATNWMSEERVQWEKTKTVQQQEDELKQYLLTKLWKVGRPTIISPHI